MNDEQFEVLDKKMNALIGLLTLNLTQDKLLQEKVALLNSLGFGVSEISRILGKPINNVKNALHESRQKKKQTKKNSD